MEKHSKYIGIISLIISVIALGVSLFQSHTKEYDSMMFAVAMLAALVTILIGWNIYTMIDIKGFKKELNERSEKQRSEYFDLTNIVLEKNNNLKRDLTRFMYLNLDEENQHIKDVVFLTLGLDVLLVSISTGSTKTTNDDINKIINRIKNIEPISEAHKESLLEQMLDICKALEKNHVKDIESFSSLKKLLLNIPTSTD